MAPITRSAGSVSVQERPILHSSTGIDEALALVMEDESDLTPLEDVDQVPEKQPRTPKKKAAPKKVPVEDDKRPGEERHSKSRNTRKPRKRATSQENTVTDSEVPPKKRKRACKPEPIYIIPDVEKKATPFRGRLGYACLNTVLRTRKPANEAIFCSRTCRIDTIKKNGIDWVKDLGRQNAEDMLKIIEWNEKNNIRFMRISSDMFPYASHETYGYSLEYCAAVLAQIGALAKRYGHRLTTHPGQFTQLGSPRGSVVRSSIRELEYHAEMLDRMGIDQDGVMIIHGGGVYGDKGAALARMKDVIKHKLPARVRARLVLENDELCYNAADLLPVCTELAVPLVFDYHHGMLNPSPGLPPSAIITQANEIFRRRGIRPKQHYSEPRAGAVSIMELRAHSDRCQTLPEGLPDDMDLMIEAKDKEQAVLHLYRIYDLCPVIHASLRPPVTHETKETKGRKSARKTRSQK
ncbi:UV-endonuclease UvdE [Boletus reticuloceps]|uniref:UV-endonuclease UvdE n=1 Tax=Boletus reticuloceps TaxID=495285 RepID=A0A8I2YRI1_9AGAM|nr:UV-endonuclease UvdE [Boletus reticuloceps]